MMQSLRSPLAMLWWYALDYALCNSSKQLDCDESNQETRSSADFHVVQNGFVSSLAPVEKGIFENVSKFSSP